MNLSRDYFVEKWCYDSRDKNGYCKSVQQKQSSALCAALQGHNRLEHNAHVHTQPEPLLSLPVLKKKKR